MVKKVKFAPLNAQYMVSSMLGFLISAIYVYKISPSWGVAFSIVFAAMFFASVASMTHAEPDAFVEIETKGKRKKKK
ncbi:hypothetical protein JW930_03175 [Candidatus Woesearchaeota archaeon]|nr:hypothetical protein [Candidatus Woesearchaeota archaeon]